MDTPTSLPLAVAVTLFVAGCASEPTLERTGRWTGPARPAIAPSVLAGSPAWAASSYELGVAPAGAALASLDDEGPYWEKKPRWEEAEERTGFRAKDGWFLAPAFAWSQHSDEDLDGQKFLAGPFDTIVLPNVDDGDGYGISAGYRRGWGSLALNLVQTEHDGVWLGTPFDVTFESISLDFTHYFLRTTRLQPFLTLGVAMTKLDIDGGSMAVGPTVADARLEDDFSGNLGGGLAVYLTRRLAILGTAVYRVGHSYHEATGVAPKVPNPPVDDGGVTATVALSFTF
jgi:hypothetical protein